MKNPNVILILTGIAVLGLLFLFVHFYNSHAKVAPPTKATPVSFTDSNGNQFTVYVGGVAVNGTNVVVTNLNVKFHPVQPATPANQQTNKTSK